MKSRRSRIGHKKPQTTVMIWQNLNQPAQLWNRDFWQRSSTLGRKGWALVLLCSSTDCQHKIHKTWKAIIGILSIGLNDIILFRIYILKEHCIWNCPSIYMLSHLFLGSKLWLIVQVTELYLRTSLQRIFSQVLFFLSYYTLGIIFVAFTYEKTHDLSILGSYFIFFKILHLFKT